MLVDGGLFAVSTVMQSLPSDTDEQTVSRVLAGDIQAFEVLMRRHNQRLYRTARAILRNDADAEDAVQQAYVNAYRQLAHFEGRAQFSTWLTRILVHEALSARRRRTRSGEHLEAGVRDVTCNTPDPERHTYVAELGLLIKSALTMLPAGYRSVFVLRKLQGLTTTETAQRLALSESATKARLHRARGMLQHALRLQRSSQ